MKGKFPVLWTESTLKGKPLAHENDNCHTMKGKPLAHEKESYHTLKGKHLAHENESCHSLKVNYNESCRTLEGKSPSRPN